MTPEFSVRILAFSPAGHTRRAAEFLAAAWTCEKVFTDLVPPDVRGESLSSEALCIAAVPSFAGRVPAAAAERFRRFSGNGAAAVALVTYGNRAYEDTLLELSDILRERSFRVIACVAVPAEHSLVPSIAAGRPSSADAAELLDFGKRIAVSFAAGETTSGTLVPPGCFPYRAYGTVPLKPSAGRGCTRCGICAKECPVGAIPPDDPGKTDGSKCITCMRCVTVCPAHARNLNPLMLALAGAKLRKLCAGVKANELYLPR